MVLFDGRDVGARDPFVVTTEEAQHRARRLAEVLGDAGPVEGRGRVDLDAADRGQVRVAATHAESGDPDRRGAEIAQPPDHLDDVGAAVGVLQAAEHRAGRAGILRVGPAPAEPPVEVGRGDRVTLRREAFADPEQLGLHAVAFHHHDDPGPGRRRGGERDEERNCDGGHDAHDNPLGPRPPGVRNG